jgi:hypothetical protein
MHRMLRWSSTIFLMLSCVAALACQPANIKAATSGPKSNFKDLPSMIAAMQGTWIGCDDAGNQVKLTVGPSGGVTGTMARYANDYRTDYTDCDWRAQRNSLVFPNTGEFNLTVTAIACAGDPNARDATHGDTGELYLFGGRDNISHIVVEVKFRKYAVVTRAQ